MKIVEEFIRYRDGKGRIIIESKLTGKRYIVSPVPSDKKNDNVHGHVKVCKPGFYMDYIKMIDNYEK